MLITLVGNAQQTLANDSVKLKPIDTTQLAQEDEPLTDPVIYNAQDSIRYEAQGNKIYLFGNSYVEYQSMKLKAEFIEIDNEKNIITAFGKKDSLGNDVGTPVFNDDQQEITCRKMIYNLKTQRGKIYDVLTKEGDLLLLGSEVKKDSNNVVYMKNLRCIPCEFQDARTIFKAKRAKIIPNDKIVTGPMYLEIGGVPTPLGLPFGFFPNTKRRHSGILLPMYGNSENLGFSLRDGGFYLGISDQTDMIIRGDVYSNLSWALRTVNNYNVNYKYQGALSLGYSEFRSGEREIPSSFGKQKDISINWRHIQDQKSNPTIRFSSDVNVRTSQYNRFNAVNTGQYLTNTFQSNINFTKTFDISSLSINARHNQNTQTKLMEISFPELTFNVNRFFPFKTEGHIKQTPIDKIGISYLVEARNTLSGYDTAIFKGDVLDRLKYGVRHSLPIATNITLLKYFTLTPALNLSAVMYTKTTEKSFNYAANSVLTDTIRAFKTGYDANFSTSLNTKIFMDYVFKSNHIKQIRHLLIPTLNYTYRPDFGETQYGFWKEVITDTLNKRVNKYSVFENTLFGGPAIGKQNAVSINLNNNLEAKIRQTTDTGFTYRKVILLQNVSINGSYNFAADSMKLSVINVSGRTKIWKYFDVLFSSTFDPYYTNPNTRLKTKYYGAQVEGGKILDFIGGNIALNASFSSNMIKVKTTKPDLTNGAEKEALQSNLTQQERLPWNLNTYYNINFIKEINVNTNAISIKKVQTLNFSGDIAVTKYWKLGLTSGFDFNTKNLSYTSVNVYRDMRCWEARIDWVPFGFRKSYSLSINLKSSMLSDIKIPRQRQWYDNL